MKPEVKKDEMRALSKADVAGIHMSISEVSEITTPMENIFADALDVESRVVTRADNVMNFKNIDNSMDIKSKGRNSELSLSSQRMKESMEAKFSTFTRYNSYGFGINSLIVQATTNTYLENNMPKLMVSALLFVNDVCYGSSFDADVNSHEPYSFYEKGVQIKDKSRINTLKEILEPNDITYMSSGVKSVHSIDHDAFYTARRDGCAFVRVIPNRKIATELYIKYNLKEAKIKAKKDKHRTSPQENMIKKTILSPKDKGSLESINGYLHSLGLESVNENTNLLTHSKVDVIESIPPELLTTKEDYEFITDVNLSKDDFETQEYNSNETFRDFVSRYTNNRNMPIYSYFTTKNEKQGITSAKELLFAIDVRGSRNIDPNEIVTAVENAIHGSNGSHAMECSRETIGNLKGNIDSFDERTLDNMSFDDIYNLDINSLLSKRETCCAGFSTESMYDSVGTYYSYSLTPKERLVLGVVKSMGQSYDNLTSNFSMEKKDLSGLAAFSDPTKSIIDDSETGMDRVTQSRVNRMFANIRGETIEFLDNRCLHPVMAGDKLMGVFQLEFDNDTLSNLVSARASLSGGSATGHDGAAAVTLQTAYDDTNQDMYAGKLTFTDVLKPLLERHMSKDFIKDNIELGNTFIKLMNEHDASFHGSVGLGSGVGCYAKINFIPIDELVFYRNGNKGLGESTFKKAEAPAHAFIILRDEYLGWSMTSGKGYSVVQVPQGASRLPGEAGMSSIEESIQNLTFLDRSNIKNSYISDGSLTHNFIVCNRPPGTEAIQIDTLEMPEFRLDGEHTVQLEQEATELVGYNCSLYSSRDGNVELAKKLFEINGTKMLEVVAAQKLKARSTNQLATTILRLRGGDSVKDIVVTWNAPTPNKINNDISVDIIASKLELIGKYTEVVVAALSEEEGALGDDITPETVKAYIIKLLMKNIFKNDPMFGDVDGLLAEVRSEFKIRKAETTEEK